MIRNRRHGHIGLATNDIEATAKWYQNVLGFTLMGEFETPDGIPIKFLKNHDIVYEMFQPGEPVVGTAVGKIDHYAFESSDIEGDYQYCVKQGYKITTEGIEGIPTLWERGVRYFKIESPSGEELEFCQVL